MFATVRDLGEVANVWAQFNPVFMQTIQGASRRDSAFAEKKVGFP